MTAVQVLLGVCVRMGICVYVRTGEAEGESGDRAEHDSSK